MENSMQVTAKWSWSKPEVEFQYGGRLIFQTPNTYISHKLIYVDEIWFADRFWPSEGSDIKCETGNSIERPLDKAIWRNISTVAAAIWTKFGRMMQNEVQITGKWTRSEPEVEFQ